MSPSDERELHRLTTMLASLDASLPAGSPLREALAKAGLALSTAFVGGLRELIDRAYASLNEPLSEEMRARLKALGIVPEADNR